jgi:hypothetical protein
MQFLVNAYWSAKVPWTGTYVPICGFPYIPANNVTMLLLRMNSLHFFSQFFLIFTSQPLINFLFFQIPTLSSFKNMNDLNYTLFPQLFFTIERIHSRYYLINFVNNRVTMFHFFYYSSIYSTIPSLVWTKTLLGSLVA